MDATEKKVLQTISKNLKDSATTSWKSGDVDDWADWARRMRTTISNSTTLLDSLLDDGRTGGGHAG